MALIHYANIKSSLGDTRGFLLWENPTTRIPNHQHQL